MKARKISPSLPPHHLLPLPLGMGGNQAAAMVSELVKRANMMSDYANTPANINIAGNFQFS